MFDNIKMQAQGDYISFQGIFGSRVRTVLERNYLNKKKLKLFFKEITPYEIVIHKFFIVELRVLSEFISSGHETTFTVNVKAFIHLNEVIDEYLDSKKRNVENKLHLKEAIDKMVYNPLPKQDDILEQYVNFKTHLGYRGALIDMKPGEGKTMTSLVIMEANLIDRVVVIPPIGTVEDIWINSVTEKLYKEAQTIFTSLDLKAGKKYNNEKFIVFHYESMDKLLEDKETYINGEMGLIVDEMHNFNEYTSERTKNLMELSHTFPFKEIILMTGTSIKATATEILPSASMLSVDMDKKLEKTFLKLYKNPNYFLKKCLIGRFRDYRLVIDEEKYKDKDKDIKLTTIVEKVKLENWKEYTQEAITKKMKEFIESKKEYYESRMEIYQNTYNLLYNKVKTSNLEFSSQGAFAKYEENYRAIVSAYEQGNLFTVFEEMKAVNLFERKEIIPYLSKEEKIDFKEATSVLKYLALKLQGEALGRVVTRERINCHIDIARQLDYRKYINGTGGKTIVFSKYIEVANAVKEMVETNYDPVCIYGDTTKYLNEYLKKFKDEKSEDNPLITTYSSLSEGNHLVVANVEIHIDLPFRMFTYEQAVARIKRQGQTRECFTIRTELDTGKQLNVNTRTAEIVKWSKEQVEEITGVKISLDIDEEKIEDTITLESADYEFEEYLEKKSGEVLTEEIKDALHQW